MRRNALLLLCFRCPVCGPSHHWRSIGSASSLGEIVIDGHVAEYGAPAWDLPKKAISSPPTAFQNPLITAV
jgi:hypothetical protein